jgi:hypothetical protein
MNPAQARGFADKKSDELVPASSSSKEPRETWLAGLVVAVDMSRQG